jgi:serine/threonine-protein kinase
MAQHKRGKKKEARQSLAAAVLADDWRATEADHRDAWICHVLRREAEALILPGLPEYLQGAYQPDDNDERLALLGVCQFKNWTHHAVRLYADAFAANPGLAQDLDAGHRYHAARFAALAGCGHGADAAGIGDVERERWRTQARHWLRADLADRGKRLAGGPARAQDSVRKALSQWQSEPALAGLRDVDQLAKLPTDEQAEFLALWADVAAVLARADR